jgi:hypothetical protein
MAGLAAAGWTVQNIGLVPLLRALARRTLPGRAGRWAR